MAKYEVPVTYLFNGTFYVEADNPTEAYEMVKRDCGLVLGGNIHSSLPDNQVDWEFECHPDKSVGCPYKLPE